MPVNKLIQNLQSSHLEHLMKDIDSNVFILYVLNNKINFKTIQKLKKSYVEE
jgi:hypothetical protein